MSKVTETWQEMAERGRQLAIEQGIDPDELRPMDPEVVGPAFLAEHSPSLVVLGDEIMLTWTWDQDTDALPTVEWYDCPEDEFGPEDDDLEWYGPAEDWEDGDVPEV